MTNEEGERRFALLAEDRARAVADEAAQREWPRVVNEALAALADRIRTLEARLDALGAGRG